MMVDTSKPLLHDRPPAYNTVAPGGTYGGPPPPGQGPPLLQQGNYGAIPPAAGFHPPPYQYQYPTTAGPGYPSQAISHQPYTPHPQTYIQQTYIQPSVVVVGGCPACRVGVLEDDFTCLGIMCAIFFFPLGLLFCFALRQRRCPNCGATFG